jgi:hypothetical protein
LKEDISGSYIFIVKNDTEIVKILSQHPNEKKKIISFKQLDGKVIHFDYEE